ncbi:hypothetical protein SAMN05444167_1938 [Terriglobus roseus]|uniref:Uncharacterized protein n=1 Tax=Terriglobus roseus TaxID=392734 RepID=A0A1G7JTD4_9BACT|nr:hypothetical protein SAMN05444167_1938 [Terriglobus roseus]
MQVQDAMLEVLSREFYRAALARFSLNLKRFDLSCHGSFVISFLDMCLPQKR